MSQLFHDPGAPASGQQKVLLATTAYDAPDASYTFSIQRSRAALEAADIQTSYLLLSGNCHVDDARNTVIQEFLLTDCTDLVFIDADVSWQPEALVRLCQHESVDIVGGVYPFRRDDLKARVNMPVRMIEGVYKPDRRGLIEVEGLPAGFMRISRHVLETLTPDANQYWNRTDRRSKVAILFERTFDDGNRYGGDIEFCRKWKAGGGSVHADYEMRLGHTAKSIIWDSLGAGLRRQSGTTLRHVVDKVRDGNWKLDDLSEARRFLHNPFGAQEDILALAVAKARDADGPILELGSGLTTILMAAASKNTVWCIEHDAGWAAQLEAMAYSAGVSNIALCRQPISDGWYDLSDIHDDLPERFSVALVDGPPRYLASRMPFYDQLGARCDTLVIDDVDDPGYREAVEGWASANGRVVDLVEDRAALIGPPLKKEKAA